MVQSPSPINWNAELLDQLGWHWTAQARPRLDGLVNEEYFWEPVDGAWNVRARAAAEAGPGGNDYVIDWAFPPPEPPPVTTIAWRLTHLIVGVFGDRNARYFGGPAVSYDSELPGSADEALRRLDEGYRVWTEGVRGLGEAGLAGRCREQGREQLSMAALVLHIHRECIHHLAEVALLRDLWAVIPGWAPLQRLP
ncbi:DinB family protein [Microlunatus ginsengisoli]|uniref:DinB family protein n=1 Tax=Microlunatus ginsengisoli TaxID=363863 RepID=A0ABP6ZSH1_9ACTN